MLTSGLLTWAVVVCTMSTLVKAEKLCYACNSYMAQCQHSALAAGTSNVFKARCATKCFARHGEDDAIYRGCFDAFKAVKQLTDDYVGCRNQTWNNRVRQWCLCDTDLCNTHNLGDISAVRQHSRSTASRGKPQTSHHVVVHQHTYPSAPLRTPAFEDARSARHNYQAHESNATSVRTAERQLHQNQPINPAEYRTVWNNWHTDDAADRSKHATKTAATDLSVGSAQNNNDWADASRGVLHSVHRYQQPTRNYGDGKYRSAPGNDDREVQEIAKSGDSSVEQRGLVEPIANHRPEDTEDKNIDRTAGRQAAVASSSRDAMINQREEFETTLQNNLRAFERARNVDSMKQQRGGEMEKAQHAGTRRQSSSIEPTFDSEFSNNGTTEEVLEYPYNQEFPTHPSDWLPIEYELDDSEPSFDTRSPTSKEAPVTADDNKGIEENKDYPYNQYKEHMLADENFADYSEYVGSSSKEAPLQVEKQQPEMLEEETIDYPYNQRLIDSQINPINDGATASTINFPASRNQKLNAPAHSGDTVKHTVHNELIASPRHNEQQIDVLKTSSDTGELSGKQAHSSSATDRHPRLDQQVLVHHHSQQQQQQQQHPHQYQLSPSQQFARRKDTQQQLLEFPNLPTQPDAEQRSNAIREILHAKSFNHRSPLSNAANDALDYHYISSGRRSNEAVSEIAPLKTKDDFGGFPVHVQQRQIEGSGRPTGGLLAKESNDDGAEYEKMDDKNSQPNAQATVPQIRCAQTGYYQNPKDCTQFVACLFDHNTHTKVLHLMRCPSGLVWDNHHKLCMESSSTCREGVSQADLDNNYVQFFADVNAAVSSTPNGDDRLSAFDKQRSLNSIKNKHSINQQ